MDIEPSTHRVERAGEMSTYAADPAPVSADDLPDEVVAAAKAALRLRRPESSLLALTFDSLDQRIGGDDDRPSGTEPGRRELAFRGGSMSLDLMILGSGDGCTVDGHAEPSPRSVQIALPDQTRVTADNRRGGDFRVDDVPHGPASILLEFGGPTGRHRAHTDWVNI